MTDKRPWIVSRNGFIGYVVGIVLGCAVSALGLPWDWTMFVGAIAAILFLGLWATVLNAVWDAEERRNGQRSTRQ